MDRAKLTNHVKETIAKHEANVKQFAKEVVEKPEYTLKWSGDIFKSAVTITFYKQILEALNNPETELEAIIKYVQNDIISRATYIYNKSTSTVANYIEEWQLSVRAQFIDNLVFNS